MRIKRIVLSQGHLQHWLDLMWFYKLKNRLAPTQTDTHSNYWLIYLVSSVFLVMFFDVIIFSKALLGQAPSLIALAAIASHIAIFVNTIALFSIYQPEVFLTI
jgi:hypothetical protein